MFNILKLFPIRKKGSIIIQNIPTIKNVSGEIFFFYFFSGLMLFSIFLWRSCSLETISMPTRLDYDWKKNLTQTQTQTQTQSQTLHFEKKTSVRCLLRMLILSKLFPQFSTQGSLSSNKEIGKKNNDWRNLVGVVAQH